MHALFLCAFAILPLVGIVLVLRKLFGLYPWDLGGSFSDLLVLPLVGAYLLLLLAAGQLARCADLWSPRAVRKRPSLAGSPRRRVPAGAISAST